ncbi:hypothetical protein GCM10027418_11300 [Mariniluteicoccus endophyticus]
MSRPQEVSDPTGVHRLHCDTSVKVGGTRVRMCRNTRVFHNLAGATRKLLYGLVTSAPPKDREVEAEKARQRGAARFRLIGQPRAVRQTGRHE